MWPAVTAEVQSADVLKASALWEHWDSIPFAREIELVQSITSSVDNLTAYNSSAASDGITVEVAPLVQGGVLDSV